MIKKEWQSLLKNKFMVVVVIAIMIIPTIYTTIFLGSMWDPYGEVDKLPVAVVNEDESVVYNDKTMDVGSELVKKLKENNSLDFNFVDKDVAKQGLENGTYYMVITIPENFSKNATTLMDDNPKEMELSYETNPGTNYIASKLSETAVAQIKSSIQEKVTKQYAETIFDELKVLGKGLKDAADGTNTALDGVKQLQDGNNEITTNLETLASSSLKFKDGAETLEVGLRKYTDGVVAAENGSKELSNGIAQYTAGVNSAKNGAAQIENGLGQVNGQVPILIKGAAELAGNSPKLNEGMSKISTGSQGVLDGLNTMSGKIDNKLDDKNKENIAKLEAGLPALNNGIQQLNDTLNKSDDASNPSTVITNSLTDIRTKAASVEEKYTNTVKEVSNTNAFKSLSPDQQAEILKVLNDNGTKISGDLKSIGSDATNTGTAVSAVNDQMTTLKTNVNEIAEKSSIVLPGSKEAISSLSSGLSDVQDALKREGNTPETMGLIQAMTSVNNGVKDEQAGLKRYTDGVNDINDKAPVLGSAVDRLHLGSGSLLSGLNTLDSKSDELNLGSNTLTNGLGTLSSNNGSLLSGASQLAEGSDKISDGAGKLRDGSKTLGNGLGTLYDGTVTLNNGLKDGSDKVNSMNPSDSTYDMIASPVSTEETQVTKVENNGSGMAPYMMCVGLWVACMAICMMYPLTKHSGKVENGFKWWLSKATILGIVAIGQATIMILMLKAINGLNPVETGKIIFVACLASLTFMAIMYFFNMLLGKVGSFILLIFMVLQLGGCAGTYPLQLSAKFYNVINPFMPFTYCVHAFRSAICGGASITKDVVVLLSILAVVIALTIAVFNVKARKEKNEMEYADEVTAA